MEDERKRTTPTDDVGRVLVELGGLVEASLDRMRDIFNDQNEEKTNASAQAELDSLRELFAPFIELSRLSSEDASPSSSEEAPSDDAKDASVAIETLIEELLDERPSLSVRVRGELGVVHGDRKRISRSLSMFLEAFEGEPVFARREVHVPNDQIVLSARLATDTPESQWSPIVIARGVAYALDGAVEVDRDLPQIVTLTLSFPVSSGRHSETHVPADNENEEAQRPVLAFRRDAEVVQDGVSAEDADAPEGLDSKTALRSARVAFIVEEEPTARRYMTEMLQSQGFAVSSVSSVRKAHDRALEAPPDVIIVEQVQLRREPGRDALLRSFRNEPSLSGVPVVLVRNPEHAEERDSSSVQPIESSEYGFVSASISKPIESEEFLAVLEAVTKNARSAKLKRLESRSRQSQA